MIYDLAKQEHHIVQEFILKNRDLISVTEELIDVLDQVAEILDSDALSFYYFSGQLRNGLTQCVLSILRRHEVQAKLMLRHSIETACLAAYSLHNPKIDQYISNDEVGAKPVKKVTDKAYKWLKQRYPEHSTRLQITKDQINSYYAHGNLFASLLTLDRGTHTYSYFDHDDVLLEQSHIWEVGYLVCIIYDLLYCAAKGSPLSSAREDTFELFKRLLTKSQEYRLELMKEKRLAQWYKK